MALCRGRGVVAMIHLFGIDFAEDEVTVAIIDGEPQWVVNVEGLRRAAKYAPNQEAAAALIALLESRERGQ